MGQITFGDFAHFCIGGNTRTNRIEEIFREARVLQADALGMFNQGRVRNPDEKARGGTKRATEELISPLTG